MTESCSIFFIPFKVKQILGEPILGHGEESGRGRRRHIE